MSQILTLLEGEGPTAVLLVGLPRSGKSTWAQKQGVPIVDPDAIRITLSGKKHAPEVDPEVWKIAPVMLESLFHAGHNIVIVDSTSLTKERRARFASPAWKQTFVLIETSLKECQERAVALGQAHLVPCLTKKSASFEPVGADEGVCFRLDSSGILISQPPFYDLDM